MHTVYVSAMIHPLRRDNAMNAETTSISQSRHVMPRVAKADSSLSQNHPGLLASVGFAALLLVSAPALAATAPPLGTTSTYAVVSDTFTNLNNPAPPPNITALNGTAGLPVVCFTTGPGVPGTPLSITGTTVVPCPPLTVGTDHGLALANLNAQALAVSCTLVGAGPPLDAVVIGGGLPGHYPPGCYRFGGAMNLTLSTTMTLDGPGVYIFSSVGGLTTGADSSVILNGACASDVFWAPGGATHIGAYTIGGIPAAVPTFVGNIIQITDITIGHFANLTGRALAFGHTVTTDADTITVPTCAPFAGGGGGGGGGIPTLSEWAMVMLAALLAIAGFAAMRRKAR
jgi:hypothetical protein